MRWLLPVVLATLLAGCGIDGEPEPFDGGGVEVSGEGRIGVVGTL